MAAPSGPSVATTIIGRTMSIFAVLTEPNNKQLEEAISATFPKDFIKIRNGQFLVSGPGTAIDISGQLAVTDGKNGSAVILTISSYYGRADVSIWEWIKTKWSADGG